MIDVLRSRGPWGLLGAVLAVMLVEAGVRRLDLDLSRVESFDRRRARQAAERDAPGCDVLAFGTSMVHQNIIPRVIEKHTGRTAYNLALGGGRISTAYYLLGRAIRSGARPSAVLIDVHPSIVTTPSRSDENGWGDALGLKDALDMAWTVSDPGLFTGVLLEHLLPTYHLRFRIREAVVATLAGREWSFRLANLSHLRNYNRNRGAIVHAVNQAYRGEVNATYRRMLLGPPLEPDPHEWLYLERFVSLARDHGARVYWVIPPFAPLLQREREGRGQDAHYDRLVDRLVKKYDVVTVLDARRAGYAASVFNDASHMSMRGAYVLSRAVAGALGPAGPDAPRLVALGPYRDGPVDVPLEDTSTSRAAAVYGETRVRR